jgi:hypothetical protein
MQSACTFYSALASRIAYPQMRQFRSNQKPKFYRMHGHAEICFPPTSWPDVSGSVTLQSMPWDIRSEAAKERIIAFGVVLVLVLVAVLGVLTFVGMEFITKAVR